MHTSCHGVRRSNHQAFLEPQIRDHGGNTQIDAGLWLLFAAGHWTPSTMPSPVRCSKTFVHLPLSAASEDDQWTVYYVDDANRAAAIHWLDDLTKILAGAIRLPGPATAPCSKTSSSRQASSDRAATFELHTAGAIAAEFTATRKLVRSLLDRLHQREPLFFSAFLTLLTHHLIDSRRPVPATDPGGRP